MTTRREFLGQVGTAGFVSLGTPVPTFLCRAALAAETNRPTHGRILVVIELAGGNDGLNTVIPHGDPIYYKLRPGIGIPQPAVLKIDNYLGLHPAMKGFKDLYDEGLLAIVQGVGYDNPNRSHFRSMDIWHSARPDAEYTQDGWLGRGLDQTAGKAPAGIPALALGTEKLPLALVSAKVNVPMVRDFASYQLELGSGSERDRKLRRRLIGELADAPATAQSDLDFLRRTAQLAYTSAEKLRSVAAGYKPAAEYPPSSLGQRLKTIAQMIAADLGTRIFFVSLDGFDTHSQQSPGHQALLAELTDAVRAFVRDLKGHKLAERLLLVTFSEFGRRVKENGSLGTDHGAASQMFVVSTAGKPGLHGKHPALSDLVEGDLKHHTDFRAVYATVLEKWLGIPSEPVLGRRFHTLDFV
jgi:uncharacterized protein (DUF1501 family)